MKSFTIGIPCYNQAEFLPDAIQSALDQTQKCEIIVVNDGSKDDALEVARSFPVKVVDQKNKGLPSARNAVIMNATSEYLLFLDADDILKENAVEELSKIAEETDADIIAPSFKCFGISNHEVILGNTPTLEHFKTANRIGYFSAIKRSVLLECGGYSPRMVFGWEDYHLWFDLLSRGKTIITTEKVLVLYRTKERSMIHEANEHAAELSAQLKYDFPQLMN